MDNVRSVYKTRDSYIFEYFVYFGTEVPIFVVVLYLYTTHYE